MEKGINSSNNQKNNLEENYKKVKFVLWRR